MPVHTTASSPSVPATTLLDDGLLVATIPPSQSTTTAVGGRETVASRGTAAFLATHPLHRVVDATIGPLVDPKRPWTDNLEAELAAKKIQCERIEEAIALRKKMALPEIQGPVIVDGYGNNPARPASPNVKAAAPSAETIELLRLQSQLEASYDQLALLEADKQRYLDEISDNQEAKETAKYYAGLAKGKDKKTIANQDSYISTLEARAKGLKTTIGLNNSRAEKTAQDLEHAKRDVAYYKQLAEGRLQIATTADQNIAKAKQEASQARDKASAAVKNQRAAEDKRNEVVEREAGYQKVIANLESQLKVAKANTQTANTAKNGAKTAQKETAAKLRTTEAELARMKGRAGLVDYLNRTGLKKAHPKLTQRIEELEAELNDAYEKNGELSDQNDLFGDRDNQHIDELEQLDKKLEDMTDAYNKVGEQLADLTERYQKTLYEGASISKLMILKDMGAEFLMAQNTSLSAEADGRFQMFHALLQDNVNRGVIPKETALTFIEQCNQRMSDFSERSNTERAAFEKQLDEQRTKLEAEEAAMHAEDEAKAAQANETENAEGQ